MRLGGMVAPGSLETQADGITVTFTVTGREQSAVPVRYAGILPDLFVEGSGVVVFGGTLARGGSRQVAVVPELGKEACSPRAASVRDVWGSAV